MFCCQQLKTTKENISKSIVTTLVLGVIRQVSVISSPSAPGWAVPAVKSKHYLPSTCFGCRLCYSLQKSVFFFFGVLVIRPRALVGSACTREQLRGGHRRCAADLFPQFIAQVLLDSLFWDCFCFILFPSLFSRCRNSPSKATCPVLDSRSISLNSHNTLNKYLWPAPRSHSQLDIPTEVIFGKGRSRSCKVM